MYAYEAGKKALIDFVDRMGWKGDVRHNKHLGFYRIEYRNNVLTHRPDLFQRFRLYHRKMADVIICQDQIQVKIHLKMRIIKACPRRVAFIFIRIHQYRRAML